METTNKERRVVNIDRESFNIIKEYCDRKTLNLSKWLAKLAVDTIIAANTEEYNPPSTVPDLQDYIVDRASSNKIDTSIEKEFKQRVKSEPYWTNPKTK
jgi:hypothetical protein